MMYEVTYPIIIDGKFVGVAGTDTLLKDMEARLKKVKPYLSTEFMLITANEKIVVCTDNPDP